jgi:streptogramin lyase
VGDDTGTLRAIDGRTDRVVATVDLGRPDPRLAPVLVAGGGLVWSYRLDTGDVALIDPATATVVRHATVRPARPLAANVLRYAHGALWIAQPTRLWRIGPDGAVTSSDLPAGFAPSDLAATARWLWLVAGRRLVRIDPANPAQLTGATLADGARELMAAADGLYAIGVDAPTIRRLDPDSGGVTGSFRPGHDELALSLVDAGTQVWATGNCGDLVRLSDQYNIRVSNVSQDLPSVAALGAIWVGDEVRSQIVRIDAATGRVLARMPFSAADPDDPAFGLVAGRSSVWVLDGDLAGGVSRVDTTANRAVRILPGKPASGALSAVVAPIAVRSFAS